MSPAPPPSRTGTLGREGLGRSGSCPEEGNAELRRVMNVSSCRAGGQNDYVMDNNKTFLEQWQTPPAGSGVRYVGSTTGPAYDDKATGRS